MGMAKGVVNVFPTAQSPPYSFRTAPLLWSSNIVKVCTPMIQGTL